MFSPMDKNDISHAYCEDEKKNIDNVWDDMNIHFFVGRKIYRYASMYIAH